MTLIQIIVLSLIQGLTEFLPVSSSAHLILGSRVFSWPDQGLVFDVATHLVTLLAVLVYFRKDLWNLVETLDHKDVHLRVLDIGIDTSAPQEDRS